MHAGTTAWMRKRTHEFELRLGVSEPRLHGGDFSTARRADSDAEQPSDGRGRSICHPTLADELENEAAWVCLLSRYFSREKS